MNEYLDRLIEAQEILISVYEDWNSTKVVNDQTKKKLDTILGKLDNLIYTVSKKEG